MNFATFPIFLLSNFDGFKCFSAFIFVRNAKKQLRGQLGLIHSQTKFGNCFLSDLCTASTVALIFSLYCLILLPAQGAAICCTCVKNSTSRHECSNLSDILSTLELASSLVSSTTQAQKGGPRAYPPFTIYHFVQHTF